MHVLPPPLHQAVQLAPHQNLLADQLLLKKKKKRELAAYRDGTNYRRLTRAMTYGSSSPSIAPAVGTQG